MILSLPSQSLGTTPVPIDLRQSALQQMPVVEIKLINDSPNPALVQIGSDTHWLDAWTADVFCTGGAYQLLVSPVVIASPAPANSPSSTLLISASDTAGQIPGTYPVSLNRLTNLSAGTVNISGTPNVNIANTPSVTISGTPSVTISGTPTVSISSGSVTITSGTVNVQNVPATSLQVAQSQVLKLTQSIPAGQAGTSYNVALPAGTHAVGIISSARVGTSIQVSGHISTAQYSGLNLQDGMQAFPVLSIVDTSVDVLIDNTGGPLLTLWVVAILDTEAIQVWPANGQTPFFSALKYEVGVAASATAVILGANHPAYNLYGLHFSQQTAVAAAAAQWGIGAGTLSLTVFALEALEVHDTNFGGVYVHPLKDIEVFNEAGSSNAFRGHLTLAQL